MDPEEVEPATSHPSTQNKPTMKSSSQQQLNDTIERIPPPPSHLIRHEIATPSSIPRSCRIDSNTKTAWGQKPKAQSKPTLTHDSLWRRAFKAIRAKYYKLWGRGRRRRISHGDDPFDRTIQVTFKDEQGKEVMRYARAKFDTGNPKNLISPDFLSQFGSLPPVERDERVILDLPGGAEYISVARRAGRWTCKRSDSYFHFDAKFMDAEFEVSDFTERFDVIIGSDTIWKERILEVRRDIGFTGFRTRTNAHNQAEINKADEQHKKNREVNEARKKALAGKTSSPAKPEDNQQ